MGRRLWQSALLVGLLAAPASALAQDGEGDAPAGEIRRDPDGITGISPYNEALAKGRKAFQAGDHDGAVAAFDEAIGKKGDAILAYLLKAQTQLDKGDLAGATATMKAGEGKKGTEQEQSKMLFLASELDERNANANKDVAAAKDKSALETTLRNVWDKVKGSWTAYAAFLTEHTKAPDYSATATDRKGKVDDRVKREKDYGAVKARAGNQK